jgi:hypothetical protein
MNLKAEFAVIHKGRLIVRQGEKQRVSSQDRTQAVLSGSG